MPIPNTTYRILVEKLGDSNPSAFIGNEGELFYDPNTPNLKLSNGLSVGGLPVGGETLTPEDIGAATAAQGELADSAVQPGDLPGVVTTSTAGLQPATGYDTIAYAATVTLDFAALNGQMKTITLTGALELLASNLANGREVRLRLIAGESVRTLTFPANWKFWSAKPATLPANKEMALSLAAFGSASTDVRAIALVEP